jgi:hypothetical protein
MTLALLAIGLLAVPAPGAQKLGALVDRVAQAYGGEKALSRVRAVRETGTLETQRGTARMLRLLAPPDRLRVEIAYPEGRGEVRVLDGPHGYRNGEMVSGPPRDAMVLQAARLDLPGLLLRKRAKLVDLGEVVREGRKLLGIGVPLDGSLNVAIAVDPQSARIVRSEGALSGAGGMRFATVYSDFRTVDGVLFAFHEENFAGGQHTGMIKIERVEILAEAPSGSFAPRREP